MVRHVYLLKQRQDLCLDGGIYREECNKERSVDAVGRAIAYENPD